MSGVPGAILFEAVSRPPAGLSARGMRWVCGLAVAVAAVPGVLFAALGAWPVLGFLGVEVLLVLGLLALHRRWSRAAGETVVLAEGRLVVSWRDGRGGGARTELDAYWAKLDFDERPGAMPLLTVHARGRSAEVGRFLSEDEKRDLAAALGAALRGYRAPQFDNPQLQN